MEQMAKLHIEKLPEGFYLATSEDIPGLVVQGRTVAETVEIARDVAKKLLEAQMVILSLWQISQGSLSIFLGFSNKD